MKTVYLVLRAIELLIYDYRQQIMFYLVKYKPKQTVYTVTICIFAENNN